MSIQVDNTLVLEHLKAWRDECARAMVANPDALYEDYMGRYVIHADDAHCGCLIGARNLASNGLHIPLEVEDVTLRLVGAAIDAAGYVPQGPDDSDKFTEYLRLYGQKGCVELLDKVIERES